MPPVAQAQVLMAQSRGNSTYQKKPTNKLLEQGASWWRLEILRARSPFINAQLAWSKKSPNFSGIGYLQAHQGNFSAAAAAYRQALWTPTMPIFTITRL